MKSLILLSIISDLSKWQKTSAMGLATTVVFALVYVLVRNKGMSLIHGNSNRIPARAELCDLYVRLILDKANHLEYASVACFRKARGVVGLIPAHGSLSADWLLLALICRDEALSTQAEICYGVDALPEHKVLAADIAAALREKGWTVMAGPSNNMRSDQPGYAVASSPHAVLGRVTEC